MGVCWIFDCGWSGVVCVGLLFFCVGLLLVSLFKLLAAVLIVLLWSVGMIHVCI